MNDSASSRARPGIARPRRLRPFPAIPGRARAGRAAWLVTALASLMLVQAGATLAQPTSLLPTADPEPAPPQAAAPPAPMAPAAPPAGPATREPAIGAPIAPAPARIQVSELDAPDARSLGTLTPQRGGLGPQAWLGSHADEVLPLLDGLRGGSRSAIVQDLTRRLLLTPADPPQGISAAPFLDLRVAILLQAGAAADALDLADTTRPDRAIQEDLDRAVTEATWLLGAARRACTTTRDAIREMPSPFWERSNLLCHLAAGDEAMAGLTANAIAESGERDAFIAVAQALAQGRTVTADLMEGLSPRALDIALLRLAAVAPPADLDRGASPAALAAIAELPDAPLGLRRRAAEAAVIAGALPVAELAAIWRIAAAEEDGADGLAQAYRALADEIEDAALPRAEDATILALLQAGGNAGQTQLAARAAAPLLERLPPDQSGAMAAEAVIRAFVRAGATEQALSWWQRLRARRDQADYHAAAAGVWPLLFLAAPRGVLVWSDDALEAWTVASADLPDAVRERRRDLFLALADALGIEFPPGSRGRAVAADAGPAPLAARTGGEGPDRTALLQEVEAAAREGRRGSAVLAAVALLRPEGPAAAELPDLLRILRAFRELGMEEDARRMAVERALRAGL